MAGDVGLADGWENRIRRTMTALTEDVVVLQPADVNAMLGELDRLRTPGDGPTADLPEPMSKSNLKRMAIQMSDSEWEAFSETLAELRRPPVGDVSADAVEAVKALRFRTMLRGRGNPDSEELHHTPAGAREVVEALRAIGWGPADTHPSWSAEFMAVMTELGESAVAFRESLARSGSEWHGAVEDRFANAVAAYRRHVGSASPGEQS